MKHRLLLISLIFSFGYSLHGMEDNNRPGIKGKIVGALNRKRGSGEKPNRGTNVTVQREGLEPRKLSNDELTGEALVEQRLNDMMGESDMADCVIGYDGLGEMLVEYRTVNERREGDYNIIWKTLGEIAKEKEPVTNPISTYKSHYKNQVRWRCISKVIYPRLSESAQNQFEVIQVPVPLDEYLAWRVYRGTVYKQDALQAAPGIISLIENSCEQQNNRAMQQDEENNSEEQSNDGDEVGEAEGESEEPAEDSDESPRIDEPRRRSLKDVLFFFANLTAIGASATLFVKEDKPATRLLNTAVIVGCGWNCWKSLQKVVYGSKQK